MTPTPLQLAIAITRALGHPGRLRTVAMLREGELCVCQITEVLHLAPSTVSLHLKELKRAWLISERREGRWVYVALSDDPGVRPWIDTAVGRLTGDPQLEVDAKMVEELRRLPVGDLCRFGYEATRAKAAAAKARQAGRRSGRVASGAPRRRYR